MSQFKEYLRENIQQALASAADTSPPTPSNTPWLPGDSYQLPGGAGSEDPIRRGTWWVTNPNTGGPVEFYDPRHQKLRSFPDPGPDGDWPIPSHFHLGGGHWPPNLMA